MISAYCDAPGNIELREAKVPEPDPEDVLLRVESCGICGSDIHYFLGHGLIPSTCPGHEISASVAGIGSQVRGLREGDAVVVEPLLTCRDCRQCRAGNPQRCSKLEIVGYSVPGGFSEYLCLPAYTLYRHPENVDSNLAALTEPLAVVVHGINLGKINLAERVMVQGTGTIGLLAVIAAKTAGAGEIWATARYPQQIVAARKLGASRVFTADQESELAELAREHPIDVVIETVGGCANTLNEALRIVKPGGSIVTLGIFTEAPPLNALDLVLKEARLVGALTYARGVRSDFEIAIEILGQNADALAELNTHRLPLESIQEAFGIAADKTSGAIKVAIGTS